MKISACIYFKTTFKLEINWNGKCHRVPLKPAMPDKPRIWVRFWGTCRGTMALLPNSYFDEMLEAAGFSHDGEALPSRNGLL